MEPLLQFLSWITRSKSNEALPPFDCEYEGSEIILPCGKPLWTFGKP